MEQTLLSEIQERVSQLEKLKVEVENTKKQISEKEQEIQNFRQDWKNNCPHAFYRVQELVICTTSTVGYYCCLCGTYQRAIYPKVTSLVPYRPSRNHIQKRRRPTVPIYQEVRQPIAPPSDINAPNFIGTVIESIYADGRSKEDSYPIPPEYQAEVDSKKEQLSKLETAETSLKTKLENLESYISLLETELNKMAHLLNEYFGYPKIVYEPIHHWTRDDFNYDPFD